jgi:hypothetical protein
MLLAVPRTDACIILYSSSADSPQTNHPTSHDSYKKENNSNSNVLHNSSFTVLNSIREWFVTSMDRIIMWNMNTTTDLGGNKQSTLSIVEISNMRVRDIKRRLAREHGYGADEISKMIDKKELINALSYEEHRVFQKELVKRKRVALRRSIMVALVCVILVMFRPLLFHAWEVLLVNVQVYTDKKRYEWSRIREYHSFRAAWGFFLILCINGLQLWLTVSVLVSWITPTDIKKKWLDYYLFPVPYIPIRPAALLATATTGAGNHYSSSSSSAGGGPLAHYGINVGPMLISWLFQYVTGKVEMYMGRALSEAHRYQRKQEKRASKKRQGRKTTGSKKKSSQVTGTVGADAAASYDDTVTDNNVHDTNTTSTSFTTTTTTKTTNTTNTAAASPQTREESPLNRTETATTNISKPNNSASESTTSFLDQHVYGAMDELD